MSQVGFSLTVLINFILKVVDDLVSKVDDPPMEDAELEQLDARLTPPPPLSGDETVEADRNGEKSSNFGGYIANNFVFNL